jgi:Ca2+/Na+ antiporter
MTGMWYEWIKLLGNNFVLLNLPIIIALILLASVPFFILQEQIEIANQIASYAYYLLIVGVIWKFIQYLSDKRKTVNNTKRKKLEASD